MTKNSTTIQEKITQLDTLVAWFDGDEFSLEKATDVFKKAEVLAREIETDLTELKNEVEIVKASFDK
ncbi:MAG TPA: exodeoxyribonuclease VII small subunit [Candidatus Saccharibacteria bacterium]|nr:exodeoxyribonuclease VII small subunit [Candidatus Saccharibacteria bacterium]